MNYSSTDDTSSNSDEEREEQQHIRVGILEVIEGGMFAGKSTELERILRNSIHAGKKVLWITHKNDITRCINATTETPEGEEDLSKSSETILFNNCVYTHKQRYDGNIGTIGPVPYGIIKESHHLLPSCKEIEKYDTIGIDEAQFFPNLEKVLDYIGENINEPIMIPKRVIICGLNSTFQRNGFTKFESIKRLADRIRTLKAVCIPCAKRKIKETPALFTHRISSDKDEVVIGGTDKYIPVCRSCYLRLNKGKDMNELGVLTS